MINVVYSTEHWIVPIAVMVILAILLVAIVVTEGMARVKAGGKFFEKPGRFFIENCDYVKVFGTLVLFAAYIVCLNIIGFTVTSMIFVFLFNVLYAGTEKKSLIISVLFGVVFNITLPSGICSITFANFGFTIY